MIVGMLFAGQDTTRNQLGRLVELLAGRPDQWVLLARRPSQDSVLLSLTS